MTAQEFQALLIEGGIDQETVAKLTGNANITTKLGQLKQAAEYQSIQQRADALLAEKQALESELIGTDAKPGSRKYQQWYSENYATITATTRPGTPWSGTPSRSATRSTRSPSLPEV